MSFNETAIDAPLPVVWGVLADPSSYDRWVVGTKEIRGHEGHWPDPGSEFHHKVGFGPLALKDKTVALEAIPGRRLVMQVRAMPAGVGIVTFELEPDGPRTVVRMRERAESGPARLVAPILDRLVHVRNAETLRRLGRQAESRHRAGAARG